jgi:hypothetical protein
MKLRSLACVLTLPYFLAHAVAAEKPAFFTTVEQSVKATRDKITDRLGVTIDIREGEPRELSLNISGEGKIKEVTGEALGSWSVLQSADGARQLVLRPKKGDAPLTKLRVDVQAEQPLKISDEALKILTLTPPRSDLFHGFVRVVSIPELEIKVVAPAGLVPIDAKDLPPMNAPAAAAAPEQAGGIPYAKPVPGKPGFVFSPYDQYKGYIDLRGFPPGTEVKDPYSGKSFLVPGPQSVSAKSDESTTEETKPLAFQFRGSTYTVPLKIRPAGGPGGH